MNFLSKLAASIKSTTISLLKWSRIVGEDNHLDWTTTSLVAVIGILVFKVSSPGLGELAALLLTLLARAHKKYLGSKDADRQQKHEAIVQAAQDEIKAINAAQDEQLNLVRAEIAALAAKTQKATEFMGDLKTRLDLNYP